MTEVILEDLEIQEKEEVTDYLPSPSEVVLEDLDALEKEVEVPIDGLVKAAGLTDEEVANFRQQGPPGFWENFKQGIYGLGKDAELFFSFFNPVGPSESTIEETRNAIEGKTSTFRDSPSLRLYSVFRAVQRLQTDDYQGNEKQKEFDQSIFDTYKRELAIETLRGSDIPSEIGTGLAMVPELMAGFLLTGGLAATAKTGVQKGAKKVLGEVAERTTLRLATGAAGVAVGTAARTAALPQFTGRTFFERQIAANTELTDKGLEIARRASEKPVTSLINALGDTYIEFLSESSGPALRSLYGLPGKALPNFMPKGLMKSLEKTFRKMKPNVKVENFFTKAGFHGFLEELGEEQLSSILKASVGIQDFGAENPEQLLDRVGASIFGWHELAVTAGVIAPVSITQMSSSQLLNMIQKRKIESEFKEPQETRELSEKEINDILEGEVQQEAPDDVVTVKMRTLEGETIEVIDEEATKKLQEERAKKQAEKAKKELTPEQKLIVEGRVQKLSDEADDVLNQIDLLEEQKAQLVQQGKPTKEIDGRLTKLTEQFDELDEQIGDLRTDVRPEVRVGLKDDITVTPQRVITTLSRKIREGVRFTKQDIKAAQTDLISVIEGSRLDLKDKGKFLRTVKNIQTVEQLRKALPQINERIGKLREAATKRRLRASIGRSLKRTKPKKRSGKPVGKFTPEIQKTLDRIREASKLTRFEANNRIQQNLTSLKLEDGQLPSADFVLENSILANVSELGSRSAKELQDISDRIKLLVEQGRAEAFLKKEAQKERREKLSQDAINTIQGSKPVKATDKATPSKVRSFIRNFMTGGKSVNGWEDIMDSLSQDDKTSKDFDSALSRLARVLEVEQKEKGDNFRDGLAMRRFAMETLGVKTERALMRRFRQDEKKIDFGIFRDLSGQEVRLLLSKSEIRKIWMEMRDPLLKESIEVQEGGYQIGTVRVNGFTQEMQEAIFTELDSQDRAFALAQMGFYKNMYARLNKQYSKDFGVDLPFNEFYSPITRVVSKQDVADTFLEEQNFRRSIDPTFVKSRVRNFEKIRVQSDIQVLQRHLLDANHYLNWSDKLKDLNSVFGDTRVRNIIDAKFGRSALNIIDGFLNDFRTKAKQRIALHEVDAAKWRRRFTVSALAFKPAIAVKQLASIPAFAEFIPTAAFVKELADPRNYTPSRLKPIINSDLLRTRGSNMERDIQAVAQSQEFELFRKNPSLINATLIFTKLGDKGAIILGGQAVYNHVLKKTGSTKQAMKAFNRATASTQQSSDISQLSSWQRGNEFAKLFTMFTSAQNQYLRRELGAIRNLFKGRITPAEFAKKFAIYHFILPMIFQFISDFGDWDDEDGAEIPFLTDATGIKLPPEQLRAMLLGSLNGYFIAGDVLDWSVRHGINALTDIDIREFPIEFAPVLGIVPDIMRAMQDLDHDDILVEDYGEAIKDLSGPVGAATGLPLKQIFNAYEGFEDIIVKDEPIKGALKLGGWSPWLVNKKFDEE